MDSKVFHETSAHFSSVISCHFSIASNNSVAWTSCQLLTYSTLSTVQKLSHILLFLSVPSSLQHTYTCRSSFYSCLIPLHTFESFFLYVALFERSLLAIPSVSYLVILYLCFQCVFFITLSPSRAHTRTFVM